MATIRRLISATLLSLMLTVVHASAALAHQGGAAGEGVFFSLDNTLLAFITSFVTGLICYALVVWGPWHGDRKGARR